MKNIKQGLGLCLALVGGVLTFFLQKTDPMGLALPLVAGLAVVAIGILAWKLPGRGNYFETFSSLPLWLILSVAGGLLLLVGNGYGLLTGSMEQLVAMAGLVTGISVIAISIGRFRGEMVGLFAHILPCLALVVKLIVEFRQWSVDPTLMDYLFRQLAVIAAMAANLHIAGYCFHNGKRRITVFFTLTAVVCSGAALVGTSGTQMMVTGGMALWMLANAGQILED